MAEFNLSEEFLLITLSRQKKTFISNSSNAIKYGLAATIVFDLIELGKYVEDGENLKPINEEPTGDSVIDLAIKILSHSENKLRNLIARLSGKSNKFKELLIKNLLDKQVIKAEGGSNNRFCFWYEKPWQITQSKLKDIIIYDKEGDSRSLTLIAIIEACKLTKKVFKNETIDQEKITRIKMLVENNIYYQAIKNSVKGNYIHFLFTVITLMIIILKELCSK